MVRPRPPELPGLRAWQFRVPDFLARHIRLAATAAAVIVAVAVSASPAEATVAITVPTSPKNLGSAATGTGTLSAQLGTVTVTASGIVAPSFVASVTSTVFTTGAGSANQTIGKASIFYWSGPYTVSTGLLGNPTPG